MSNSKHTPGPWTFHRASSCDRGDSYGVRAPAPHYCVIPTLNINPADARLIAAAPDLLEALKDALCALDCCGKDYAAASVARAAITKATGDTK
jgi:hypothetical protein